MKKIENTESVTRVRRFSEQKNIYYIDKLKNKHRDWFPMAFVVHKNYRKLYYYVYFSIYTDIEKIKRKGGTSI